MNVLASTDLFRSISAKCGGVLPSFTKKPLRGLKIPFSLKGSAKVTFENRYASGGQKVFWKAEGLAGDQWVGIVKKIGPLL
jgi:hypothetical protein